MKTLIALLFVTVSAHAKMIVAPDGRFELAIESNSITLTDAKTATPLMPLAFDTSQDRGIDAVWSPDSTRVVVVENTARGSDVIAAFFKDGKWHKTAESDRSGAAFIHSVTERVGSKIKSEQRSIAGWIDADTARIKGLLHFADGQNVSYTYTDSFGGGGQRRTSVAGYDLGAIKSSGYHTE
jgi:hypothetical protein